MNFSEKLETAVRKKSSCLMLGLDPNLSKMPTHFPKTAQGAQNFCTQILEVTEKFICGIKIQMAYFEVFGSEGVRAVENLISFAKSKNLVVLVDGKRNDIGSTCEAYATAYLGSGRLGVDSLTVNPFLGTDGISPFVKLCEKNDRGIFVLVKTSNPSAVEFQETISDKIAEKVELWGITTRSTNGFSSIGAVVGATNGEEFKKFRELMPHSWILAPGIGAQGGKMEDVLAAQKDGLGVIIPVSRSILYAGSGESFSQKAEEEAERLWKYQKNGRNSDR
ncbi:orotidine-5'-phosphate decarboxylase [Candidatus Gracilibacteria bacterium]|nr:orotidine-5'-phosphate decarboxylase [Candidatus Gracilibacteria bacterium]